MTRILVGTTATGLSLLVCMCGNVRLAAVHTANAMRQTTHVRGQVFTHPLGFSFTYPEGWTVQQTEQGLVLAPPDIGEGQPELYLITADRGYTSPADPRITQELDQLASNLFPHLQRVGAAKPFPGRRDGTIHTWDGISRENNAPARVRVFLRVMNDHAVSVTAIGSREALERRESQITAVVSSLTFAPAAGSGAGVAPLPEGQAADRPRSNALTDGSPVADQWLRRLRGKLLTSLSSYSSGGAGGYSSKTVVYLSPDGRFEGRSSSSVSVDVGGASGNSGAAGATGGRWRIYSTKDGRAILELAYENGQPEHNMLQDRNGQTFINGNRWFVTDPR